MEKEDATPDGMIDYSHLHRSDKFSYYCCIGDYSHKGTLIVGLEEKRQVV